jgi:predicted O-methyltransferase YrrM
VTPLQVAAASGLVAAALSMTLLLGVRSWRRARRASRERAALEASRQPEIAAQLAALLQPADPLPPLGGWAVTPDLALHLARHVLAERPRLVLELGSGSSSVVLAEALRVTGGKLVSLEHDAAHADRTRQLLRERGLEDVCTVVLAPLVADEEAPAGGGFYDFGVVRELPEGLSGPFDLVLIDGPPASKHPEARRPAMLRILPLLAPGGVIVLDDAVRPGEQAIVSHWRLHGLLADFSLESLPLLRHPLLLRHRPTPPDHDPRQAARPRIR